jgi:hypothetical protein
MRKGSQFLFLLLLVCAVPAFAQQSRQVIFPRFAAGDGWESVFFFSNAALSNQAVTVNFYDASGAAQLVDTNLGSNSSFSFSLNPGGTESITLDSSGIFKDGYVVADYPASDSPITGSLVYRYEVNGIVQVVIGVSQQEIGQHFSFPAEFNSTQRISTAVAFSKPEMLSPKEEYVVVSLINTDGSIQAVTPVFMKSGEHKAGYIDYPWLFPGLGDFKGSINVSSVSGIGVLALRQDKDDSGAISVDRGPMVGAFKLAGPVVQEVEPNDDFNTAFGISGSTIVQGRITTSLAGDFIKFTGTAGQIVTVICDTSQITSVLKPYIGLYDSDSAIPLVYNFQNGLMPGMNALTDSFFQIVLPRNDFYYIWLLDSNGGGGALYYYDLHIRFHN